VSRKFENSVAVISLGKRGGSVHLANEIIRDFETTETPAKLYISSQVKEKDFRTGNHIKAGFFSIKWAILTIGIAPIASVCFLIYKIVSAQHKSVLFVMPQPFDAPLRIFCKLRGIKTYSIIHELEPHQGEWWPTKKYTKFCIRIADVVIALSSYVQNQVQLISPNKITKLELHPMLQVNFEGFGDFSNHNSKMDLPTTYVLFIGRIRKYKGLSILLSAWEKLIEENPDLNCKLIIAGQGDIPDKALHLESVVVLNRWISNEEIVILIQNCNTLVLPYLEASQSGILSIKSAATKKKIISNVGGLVEQADVNTFVFEAGNIDELAEILKVAIKTKSKSVKSTLNENAVGTWSKIVDLDD
jgi:glycosyltransferase involved in cell wall biosynthesis